jgi:phospholipid N-methyltransferase
MDANENGKRPGQVSQLVLFARNFFRYPKLVGWLLPSSRFLVNQVLRQIRWEQASLIVEYGPGTGNFTQKILERMPPEAKLVAFEVNPEFYGFLKSSINDPRFHVVQRSAVEVDKVLKELGFAEADYVISGIPFKTLPDAVRDLIVRKTYSVLRPKGRFLVYQLSSAVLPYLERVFGSVYRGFELRNLVPAQLFYCAR